MEFEDDERGVAWLRDEFDQLFADAGFTSKVIEEAGDDTLWFTKGATAFWWHMPAPDSTDDITFEIRMHVPLQ